MSKTLMRCWLTALMMALPLAAFSEERLDPPDVTMIDQDRVPHRFVHDLIDGKIAVVSFIFTGCTTICSPVGANIGALDALLGADVGRKVSLISVTLDPFNDTPERIAKWRRQFDDRPGWLLLTGDPDQVDRVLRAMRQGTPDITQHDAFLWISNPRTGLWLRVSSLAPPATLLNVIHQLENE